MKWQILYSRNNKKNVIYMYLFSAELAQRAVKVNPCTALDESLYPHFTNTLQMVAVLLFYLFSFIFFFFFFFYFFE